MVKSTTSKQKPVSREILVKELSALEKRLDAKSDSAVRSMKEYTDSRWKQLDAKSDSAVQSMKEYTDSRWKQLDAKFGAIDRRFTKMEGLLQNSIGALGKKIDNLGMNLDISVKGLVEMIERNAGEMAGVETRLDNHERRLKLVEARS